MDPELVTGRGAGLTTAGYNRKVQVIREGKMCIRDRFTNERGILGATTGADDMLLYFTNRLRNR